MNAVRAPVAVVRALMARAVPASAPHVRLGAVTLRPHQRSAVTRVRRALAELNGAVLADEVGLGKTFVALALAAERADPLLVCPASLRAMWSEAMQRAGVRMRTVTHQALSRGVRVRPGDLVVVDEAHHFRNPATRRYGALAEIVADAPVLLLTATPVHNTTREMEALLALFSGMHRALDASLVARCVIRREHAAANADAIPVVTPTRELVIRCEDDLVTERILALPPPLPLEAGGTAGALIALTLLRQWASTAASLRGGIERHLARTDAIIGALRAGRLPSRRDLSAWTMGDDAMQLAFPELMAGGVAPAGDALRTAMAHREALVDLRDAARCSAMDVKRGELLRRTLRDHTGERVLCFSQFGESVQSYWTLLRHVPGVCALTSRGARVAGGILSRREAVSRFAPAANGATAPSRIEEIRTLLSTDLLSEGVNLQDASVVVHLDLPWTPARVAQRVGRIARLGSIHPSVTVYEMRAPIAAAGVLTLERRLAGKAQAATLAVDASQAAERVASSLAGWRREGIEVQSHGAVSACIVTAGVRGWLALVGDAMETRLVASVDGTVGVAPALVAEACAAASGDERSWSADAVQAPLAELERWLSYERAAFALGVDRVQPPAVQRATLTRLAALAASPRVHRSALEDAAGDAWRSAGAAMSAGRGARLRRLAAGASSDAAWLEGVAGVDGRGGRRARREHGTPPDTPLALIVFGP